MSTFLFDKTIFGPVHSRRLGVSLGVNLLPNDRKLCSFDCIYCECGFGKKVKGKVDLPTRDDVKTELIKKLSEMRADGVLPDVITFAGNGEPTLHPQFNEIISDTIAIRNQYCPKARVAVLSNASTLANSRVVEALKLVDDNILKLDSAFESTVEILDRPNYNYSTEKVINQLSAFGDNLAIQTMFAKWKIDDKVYDNSVQAEVDAWIECIKRINPPRVMIYTIDRDTPLQGMEKVEKKRLDAIAELVKPLVKDVSVSY